MRQVGDDRVFKVFWPCTRVDTGNDRFGSNSEIQPDCIDDFSPRRRSGSRFNRGQDPACGGGMLESAGFDLAVGSLSDLAK